MKVENKMSTSEFTPVALSTSKKEAKWVTLFTIDGREYKIQDKQRPQLAAIVLRSLKKDGEDVAALVMLEKLLGEENFEALMEFDDLTEEQMQTIVAIATKVVFGDIEKDPKEA